MAEIDITVEEKIEAKADKARLIISVSNNNTNNNNISKRYDDAAKAGAFKITEITEFIKTFGVEDVNIKSSRIDIKRVTRQFKNENRNVFSSNISTSYETKLIGYEYSSTITVELPSETEYLAKLYCELSSLEDIKSIDIVSFISNKEYWKDLLLEKLVTKAKHKATLLANVSGLRKVEIVNISKHTENNYSYSNYNNCSFDGLFDDDFECDDSENSSFEQNINNVLESNFDKPIIIRDTLTVKFRET